MRINAHLSRHPASAKKQFYRNSATCYLPLFLLLGITVWVRPAARAIDQVTAPSTHLVKQVVKLIEQLGDQRYTTRERAQAELSKLGLSAFEAISEAQSHHDIEISLRAKYLLRSMRINWTQDHDPPSVKTILKGYEQLGNDQRVMQMHALAQLPNGLGIEALCRLVRFERTDELSKEAAILVLSQQPPDEPEEQHTIQKTIQATLGPSQRSGALWLSVYANWFQSPETVLRSWDRLVHNEEAMLARSPDRSSSKVVRYLLRRQAEMLHLTDHSDKARHVVSRLFEQLDSGNEIQLLEMSDWLAEQQQWELIVEFADREPEAFRQITLLCYRLAAAYRELGNTERSERQAAIALSREINNDAKAHRQVAQELKSRGMLDWAEQEYRQVIKLSPPASFLAINAHYVLSEMLHDAQRDFDAANLLETMLLAIQNSVDQESRAELEFVLPTFYSRKEYFLAQHHAARGKRAQQRQALEKGIQHNPTDADVLIAMYQLPGQDEAWKTQAFRKIEQACVIFRQNIEKSPDDATYYNQLAWLIANTVGNYDEALKCSLKSLELDPHQAGYLDTLARCYFAKGDLTNAIKFQTQAVKLDPYTMQIKRQLDFFESQLPTSQTNINRAK